MKELICVLIMATVTYIPRALPITVFSKQIKSRYIRSFLHYVPYAVLGSLTFPAIFYCTSNMVAAVAGTAVAILLAYFERSLVIVAAASVATILLVNIF